MQAKSAFVWGVLATTGLLLGGRALKEPLSHWTNPHVYRLSDGTLVETIQPEPSGMREALQMKQWHFHVTLPEGGDADSFLYGLEVRENGKPIPHSNAPQPHTPLGRSLDVVIYFSPQDQSWDMGKTIQVWQSDNFPPTRDTYTSSSGKISNPFYGQVRNEVTYNDPRHQKDDSFVLMATPNDLKAGPISPDEAHDAVAIVLTMKSINYTKHYHGIKPIKPHPSANQPYWQAWFR